MTATLMHHPPTDRLAPDDPEPLSGGQHADWLDALAHRSARALAAGQGWDAVRITGPLAPLVYSLMYQQTGGDTGPVVIDSQADAHYWLIRSGYQADWNFPAVTLLTTGTWVVLPPLAHHVYRVHWLTAPRADGRLTHAPMLHSTIASAAAS